MQNQFGLFQSTHPLRGATAAYQHCRGNRRISIHAPLAGCDGSGELGITLTSTFQSTHPLRGATFRRTHQPSQIVFQSTHPLRGATRKTGGRCGIFRFQSTHPLRGATIIAGHTRYKAAFQSTHPLRGATCSSSRQSGRLLNFNPRTPCGVRHFRLRGLAEPDAIFQSTHPLRGATYDGQAAQIGREFQSTHPLRGATFARSRYHNLVRYFNPRTPCGVRLIRAAIVEAVKYFNPRTPCGVRQASPSPAPLSPAFQSTHPLRGATLKCIHGPVTQVISIHAPLAGCDLGGWILPLSISHFNPRTPCGVRPDRLAKAGVDKLFQSTHPLRGATVHLPVIADAGFEFQSTHPLRGAT